MAKDLLRKLGEIAFNSGGTAAPFEVRTTNAIKRLMFRLTGVVDISTQVTSCAAYGPADIIKSLTFKVNQQPGPLAVDGRTLFFKNFKDQSIVPYIAPVSAISVADNYAIEANLFHEFSFPNYPGGDLTIFKPKLGNVYTIEVGWGTLADLVTGGAAHFSTNPKIEVYSHEIIGLEATPNKYNASSLLQETLAINTAQRIRIPYNSLLNELHLYAYTSAGALSDSVINNVILRNGTQEVFRDISWMALKRFNDFENAAINPTSTPAGVGFLDLTINNDFSSLLNTAGMKELELVLDVAAAGTIKILQSELRDGLD